MAAGRVIIHYVRKEETKMIEYIQYQAWRKPDLYDVFIIWFFALDIKRYIRSTDALEILQQEIISYHALKFC